MNVVVLRETATDEARVALVPESVLKLVGLKASVQIGSGAGLGAARTDDDYDRPARRSSSDRALSYNPRISWPYQSSLVRRLATTQIRRRGVGILTPTR